MQISTAIEMVENLVFFPTWKFSGTDHSKRFEGAILVRVNYDAFETGRVNAIQGYPEIIHTYAEFPVLVEDCRTQEELYRKIANALLKTYEHELREALRVAGTFWAPFHPHKIDGMRNWVATKGVCDDALLHDLQFGIG